MRHQRLIWFVAGAAATAFVSLISAILNGQFTAKKVAFLVVTAPHVVTAVDEPKPNDFDSRNLSQRVGEVARKCGFPSFEISLSVSDLKYKLPISEDKKSELDCVLHDLKGVERVETIDFKAA